MAGWKVVDATLESGGRSSEAVVLFAKGVLVEIARFFCGEFGVVDLEAGGIPFFHLDHGVVFVGEGLFGMDSIYPGVNGLLVGVQELVEV